MLKKILELDGKFPFILIGAILGAALFTAGSTFGWHWTEVAHNKTVHFVSNEAFMWFFFAFLGAEITIKSVLQAGRFVGLATLGGMLIPPLVTYALCGKVGAALGACATDVAFSLGAAGMMAKGGLGLMLGALMILAVGDDLGGVGVMASAYADNVPGGLLASAAAVLVLAYFCGERGVITIKIKDDETGKIKPYHILVEVQSLVFWLALAAINTVILYQAKIEWILGGCLVFIFAPNEVKHKIAGLLKPVMPLILLVFGYVNCSIDLTSSESWGWMTAATLIGGMFGKQLGIFGGGMIGRAWSRASGEKYGSIPTGQIYGLAVCGGCNGTVAMIFVATALAKGFLTPIEASQATLGFLLTVPATYLQAFLLSKLGIVRDDPNFQPEAKEVDEGEEALAAAH